MADWQPIATIPKGAPDEWGDARGPIVLVWMPSEGHPWVAQWAKMNGEPEGIYSTYSETMSENWSVRLDGHPDPVYHPSKWMLLPAPPQEKDHG